MVGSQALTEALPGVFTPKFQVKGACNSLFRYSRGTRKERAKHKEKILFAVLSLGIKPLGKAIGKLDIGKKRGWSRIPQHFSQTFFKRQKQTKPGKGYYLGGNYKKG